jgi:sigma-B regulation protein RsbU (phosphoserine phosphatase)
MKFREESGRWKEDGVSYQEMDKSLRREIHLARNIQLKLLNGKKPRLEFGQISGVSIPARMIGGDYFDFYPLVGGKLRIIIGDVMGKGIPAAMLMILTRGAFRSASQSAQNPGETLTAMNKEMYEDLRSLSSFVTVFCGDWDPASGSFTYANAGHHIPLWVRGNKKIEHLPKLQGVMLGGLPDQTYREEAVRLNKEDLVFFYTDGIVEAQNQKKEMFNLDRLISVLLEYGDKGASVIEEKVVESINHFIEDMPQKDDITMVILKATL